MPGDGELAIGGALVSLNAAVDSLRSASMASGGGGRAQKCTDEASAALDKPCGLAASVSPVCKCPVPACLLCTQDVMRPSEAGSPLCPLLLVITGLAPASQPRDADRLEQHPASWTLGAGIGTPYPGLLASVLAAGPTAAHVYLQSSCPGREAVSNRCPRWPQLPLGPPPRARPHLPTPTITGHASADECLQVQKPVYLHASLFCASQAALISG